jgi:4-amino-4-deoxy-L-arabinose transferase-like glycosyltransferase
VKPRTRSSPRLHDAVVRSLHRRARAGWIVLLGVAVALRALLVHYSPRPDGYVYDFYFEAVEFLNTHGRLPEISECWQCYHPPFYYLLGWVFYRAGWLMSGTREGALQGLTTLSLVATCVTAWYSVRFLRLFRQRGAHLLIGGALILVFPCLFITGWGAEADSVQAALMSAFLYYLTKYDVGSAAGSVRLVILMGVLTGLAMATKHNGLLALAAAGALLFVRLLTEPRRSRTIRDGLIILALALPLGAGKYVDNTRRYGRPIVANISEAQGFVFGTVPYWDIYEYSSLRLLEAVRLYQPGARAGRLTDQPVYNSVITSLHAQAWTDMSFFSVRSRHGDGSLPYPDKPIPRPLVASVLVLGLVPGLLSVVGFVSTLDRKAFRACTILVVLAAVTYTVWFAAQEIWALKTKYLLYLLPAYATYVVVGLRVVRQWRPRILPDALLILLLALVVAAHVFLYAFATGASSIFAR